MITSHTMNTSHMKIVSPPAKISAVDRRFYQYPSAAPRKVDQ